MAITSLVLGIVGFFCCGIPGAVGAILGFVARGRIASSGGTTTGSGLALAGIITGIISFVGWILIFLMGGLSAMTQQVTNSGG